MQQSAAQTDADKPLFRAEAIAAASEQYGSPVRPLGLASWGLTAFLAVTMTAALIFMATARYARKETVPGVLEPASGALRISAAAPAMIRSVHVREGQHVVAGQPILTLVSDPMTAGGARLGDLLEGASRAEAGGIEAASSAQLDGIARQRDDLAARRDGLTTLQKRLALDRGLQSERVRLQQQSLDAARKLHDQGLYSDLYYRQREEAVVAARQELSRIERQIEETNVSLTQSRVEAERLEANMRQAMAQAQVSRAGVAEKRANYSANREVVLTAPRAGRVAALRARPGAPAPPASALAIILPDGARLEAELWAPSRAVGFVRPGDQVRVMYDAFPYQRFGAAKGRVIAVADAPTAPDELSMPIETREALYRITVALDDQSIRAYGRDWPLAPGARLTADLVLESRSFLQWLLDPLFSARRRAG
ncbi:membrane fusion protein [Caulobacter ginsengisoli]|uniref:Membrane fusion protein n=1 Tax=Caulobacter ginsengisoli TaxID=400775 RepID=A0ABU0IK75_9CAUL|nr:HlyD family efflux transporter periplasmic adaptor subunit [Caulobacter ginsengisoli]MDQ0462408.1 membrane fusion protein [Caulobacter ginsengisoli]